MREMGYAIRLDGSQPIDLAQIDPSGDDSVSKEDGGRRLKELEDELGELQELLYAAGVEALLVVLQGMDTSGKDGVIREVFSQVDPQGVHVWSFKVPTPEERQHDFLWRHQLRLPGTSMMAVFNRSYYEAVLVEPVKGIVTPDVARSRYPHINDFELLLTQSNTIVAKFFLHISQEEQLERLLARQQEVAKWWKLSLGDWEERKRWDAYQAAYQEAIAATATPYAPWYVVPADRKWFRNLAVAEALVAMLQPRREAWMDALRTRGERELAELRAAGYIASTVSES